MLDYNVHHVVERAHKSIALLTYIQRVHYYNTLTCAQSLHSVVTYMHACVTNIAIIRHSPRL
jgi:hypothetical protein